jgi:hypothetical protein
MTRINWAEVNQLNRLDEIIAYSIVTLQEAYTARDNEDLDIATKEDIRDWIRWEIGYDEQGRAFFRYAASLYVRERNPLADTDFLELIESPTRWLVNHASLGLQLRDGDTSLQINTLTDIPEIVTTMERLLFWAIVLGDWWNRALLYCGEIDISVIPTGIPPIPTENPIGYWGAIPPLFAGIAMETEGTIGAQFDAYNGVIDDPAIPDFLLDILDNSNPGSGSLDQNIDLPSKDMGAYRENLVTCEEQDPKIINYSQQQLDALLPKK